MQVDIPEIVAEVAEQFAAYEKALVSNDVDTLDELFRKDSRTIRYGGAEILYGYDEIAAFRAALEANGIPATVRLTRGRDIAAACGQLAATAA